MLHEVDNAELDRAIEEASEELGLPEYYRACVKPIVNAPMDQWPECCGGNCEPCNATLANVAHRTIAILNAHRSQKR